jgi:hypothetical protein
MGIYSKKLNYKQFGALVPRMDIIVPSCKPMEYLRPMFAEIERTALMPCDLIGVSGPGHGAAENRNMGLGLSTAPFVIMMDDDIYMLRFGWNVKLVDSLLTRPNVSIVSARLMNRDGTPAPMMSSKRDLSGDWEKVEKVPTACVAFRRTIYRFDENFKGSGFEDDAFCLAMGPEIIINNQVKVVHLNEMKNQRENWDQNKKYFKEKYVDRTI